MRKKKIFIFDDTLAARDFIHIDDISAAIHFLMNKQVSGIYNIGQGKKFLIKKIVEILAKKLNKKFVLKKNKLLDKSDVLVANIKKLRRIGWAPKKSFNNIISDFLK